MNEAFAHGDFLLREPEASWTLTGTAICPERMMALNAYSTQLSSQRKITSQTQLCDALSWYNRSSGEDEVRNLQAHKMLLTMFQLSEPSDTRRTSIPVVKITLAHRYAFTHPQLS